MKVPIRTITVGIAESHPLTSASVESARNVLDLARGGYVARGYEVQSLRISTRSIFQDLASWDRAALLSYVKDLQALVDAAHLDFCSIGSAQASVPSDRIEMIADLLIGQDLLSASVQSATSESGICADAAPLAA